MNRDKRYHMDPIMGHSSNLRQTKYVLFYQIQLSSLRALIQTVKKLNEAGGGPGEMLKLNLFNWNIWQSSLISYFL